MKVVKIELLGAPCYLSFTGEAMFQIREKFGGVKELLERVQPDTREGAAALCEAVAILAEQAELGRRHLGIHRARSRTLKHWQRRLCRSNSLP